MCAETLPVISRCVDVQFAKTFVSSVLLVMLVSEEGCESERILGKA